MRDVEVSRLRSWKKWLKLGVWAAQSRSSTPIIKSLIVILLAKNDNHLASTARLTSIKNYVIIYIMKSMPLRAPASYLFLLGKLFIAAQVFAAPIYITPVPFHDSVSIVKYLLFYFTIIL